MRILSFLTTSLSDTPGPVQELQKQISNKLKLCAWRLLGSHHDCPIKLYPENSNREERAEASRANSPVTLTMK